MAELTDVELNEFNRIIIAYRTIGHEDTNGGRVLTVVHEDTPEGKERDQEIRAAVNFIRDDVPKLLNMIAKLKS